MPTKVIRVLIVEDSSVVRQALAAAIGSDERFEVAGAFATGEEALARVAALDPDVMTVDLELPGISGIELLQKLRSAHPVPAVVVSASPGRRAEALGAGAVDLCAKPGPGVDLAMMLSELKTKLYFASTAKLSRLREPRRVSPTIASMPAGPYELIALGASTGGPGAVQSVMSQFPASSPPILIAVHMPANFTRTFAERLNDVCFVEVAEARHGEPLTAGRALVAPGGKQLGVRRSGNQLYADLVDGVKVNGHAPSVDFLFDAVAQAVGRRASAAILTGMGADGAQGMLRLRQAGARTFAQDEASCVVFGMPKAAWDLGAAQALVPLEQIAARLLAG